MKLLKRKRTFMLLSLVMAIAITIIGGGKILVYFMIALIFFIVGKSYGDIKRAYDDYRLGLRINSLQYSAKQFEAMQTENKQLQHDLMTANERIKLYKATSIQSKGGTERYDHFTDNGFAGVRENS